MKVAFLIDVLLEAGGGNSAVLAELNIIKRLNIKDLEIEYITTSLKTKKFLDNKLKKDVIYFNKDSFFNKIFLIFYQSKFIKFLLKRLKKINKFEKLLKKLEVDLLFFISPSNLVFCLSSTNFVYTIWEFQHKNYPFFPEYKNIYFDIETRDKTLNLAADNAFKIICGTKKSKEDFSYFYACDKEKILVRPIRSAMTDVSLDKNFDSKIINELKKKEIENYLFYPANYIPHKNHRFIIDAIEHIEKDSDVSIKCVFAGSNKGNLDYVKKLISEKNLSEKIFIFEYLSDQEIIYLYKNCFAVIIPSYVGTVTFPVIEGFFFKKPVISATDSLDNLYKNELFSINLKDHKSLKNTIIDMKANPEKIKSLVLNAHELFNKVYNDHNSVNQLEEIINEYNLYQKTWKN